MKQDKINPATESQWRRLAFLCITLNRTLPEFPAGLTIHGLVRILNKLEVEKQRAAQSGVLDRERPR